MLIDLLVSKFHIAELEAYCNGSWWDATVLKKDSDRYFVHYENFEEDQDEWVPLGHLRLRSRIAVMADCQNVLAPGVDVCVMSRHPHSYRSHHPHSDHSLHLHSDRSHPVPLSPFVKHVFLSEIIHNTLLHTFQSFRCCSA